MKLSEVFEFVLTKKLYPDEHVYMCSALNSLQKYRVSWADKEKALAYVVLLILKIAPNNHRLGKALIAAGYLPADVSKEDKAAYTKQLFCWVVFDLKRKGL